MENHIRRPFQRFCQKHVLIVVNAILRKGTILKSTHMDRKMTRPALFPFVARLCNFNLLTASVRRASLVNRIFIMGNKKNDQRVNIKFWGVF